VLYLRIGSLGLPFALIALAGQGFLRGVSDLRTPLVIVVAANALNVVLNVVFIYGFGWGLAGSAWATAVSQAGMGGAFVTVLLRSPADSRRPSLAAMRPLMRIGWEIFVRTASLYGSLLVASAVLARVGDDALAAHQIAFQLFIFLALILDAVAISGQVIIGRSLGAGDADGAYAAAVRMIELAAAAGIVFAVIMLALTSVLPHAFTSDSDVVHEVHKIWPLFALMQPLNGAVFALDGILIGAADTRFLMWAMLASSVGVFVPVALGSLELDLGIVGVWCGLLGWIGARLATCGWRFRGRRWAIVGASRVPA
jgi:putative MATE family efflux protein